MLQLCCSTFGANHCSSNTSINFICFEEEVERQRIREVIQKFLNSLTQKRETESLVAGIDALVSHNLPLKSRFDWQNCPKFIDHSKFQRLKFSQSSQMFSKFHHGKMYNSSYGSYCELCNTLISEERVQ
jgi:hypothetical protein